MSAHVLWVQVSVTIRSKRHVHLEIARPVLGGYHNLKLNRRRKAATRYDIAYQAYENDEIDSSTFGQLNAHNLSNKIIVAAVERSWITTEFAVKLLDADIEDEDDMNRKRIEGQIVTCNGKIAYYKDTIEYSIKAIQEVAARLSLDRCSEVDSIQAYARRIDEARAHIEELNASVTALKFMLTKSN